MSEDTAAPRSGLAAQGRRVSAVAAICAGALTVVAGVLVFASGQAEAMLLIGRVSPSVMGSLIIVLGGVALGWGVTAMSGPGVPVRTMFITVVTAIFVILVIYGFSGSVAYIEVAKDPTGRAFVVEEEGIGPGSSARLLEVNGIIAEPVARLASNNGVRAFAAGDYRAQITSGSLVLSYQVGSSPDWATETFPISTR